MLIFQIAKATIDERRKIVLDTLKNCDKRFKCGREIKKRVNIWGLRARGAPKAPVLTIPPVGILDDSILKLYCKKHFFKLEEDVKVQQNGFINSSHTGSRRLEAQK